MNTSSNTTMPETKIIQLNMTEEEAAVLGFMWLIAHTFMLGELQDTIRAMATMGMLQQSAMDSMRDKMSKMVVAL
jgi:hypothetical protein